MDISAALALTVAAVLAGPAPGFSQQAAPRTRVVLLGTGNPNADPDRWGPAVAVVVDGRSYLVDCGPGIVRRAEAARRSTRFRRATISQSADFDRA